jgi:ABC-2 type transport system permease protein
VTKVLHIALREFLATVGTKGFILGILMTPLLIGVVVVVMPKLMTKEPPKIDGEIAIIDPTGGLATDLTEYLKPEKIAERRSGIVKEIRKETPQAMKQLAGDDDATQQALDIALGSVPSLHVRELPTSTDVESAKARLHEGSIEDGGLLVLAVVDETAVRKTDPDGKFGSYELFVREKLDDRIIREVRNGLKDAIVGARFDAAGMDRASINELTRVRSERATTVSKTGESKVNEVGQVVLPAGFMVLLLVSVLTGGQYLMTTTIEEKSSRVVEVLLSAVSSMQLMTGKILGQMCVGLLIIALYAGLGLSALFTFAMMGLFDPWLLVYLLIFYFISYFVIGSMMAAVGAAVNEPREAQSFMMPIMLTVMIPWILWLPISRDPNSLFATFLSFVPPINPFVMLLRMTSTTPPPWWQVWLSILVGIASVYGALWVAAKVFRVGLLLHGKPPSFGTLIKWVRMS